MNEIQIFDNPQFGEIRILSDENNEPWFCGADVCNALGYTNPRKAIADHVDEGDVTKRDTPTTSGVQTMTFVNESGLYSLIFGSKLDNAKVFKKWVTSEVLPSIRKTGTYISPNAAANAKLQDIEVKVYLIEAISRNLRLNDASRLGMYQSIAEPYGLSIPQYVLFKGVLKSASELLKGINAGISIIKFNQLLEKNGYIETLTRPGVGKTLRKFKSITDKGAHYGQNMQSPKNQKETQPYWYADKLRELYEIVTNSEQP